MLLSCWSCRNIRAKEPHLLVNNLKALAGSGEEAWKMVEPLEKFQVWQNLIGISGS